MSCDNDSRILHDATSSVSLITTLVLDYLREEIGLVLPKKMNDLGVIELRRIRIELLYPLSFVHTTMRFVLTPLDYLYDCIMKYHSHPRCQTLSVLLPHSWFPISVIPWLLHLRENLHISVNRFNKPTED